MSVAAPARLLWPEPAWIVRAADERGWAWVRTAWRRAAAVPGAWYDAAKADAVVALWPQVFRLTEDRFAGQPFHLSAWQECVVRLLVGWKAPIEVLDSATGAGMLVHVRLFRRLMLWVPRKNGKSEFLAALGLLFWAVEGVVGGQGFVFARDEKQAKSASLRCDRASSRWARRRRSLSASSSRNCSTTGVIRCCAGWPETR
ncbi:hypothetical protein [Methylocella sp.]|uniref:hypothetical protein n=1 Tax=Methylocella sp. TaxID=1978226 RepID=UPI0035B0A05E